MITNRKIIHVFSVKHLCCTPVVRTQLTAFKGGESNLGKERKLNGGSFEIIESWEMPYR